MISEYLNKSAFATDGILVIDYLALNAPPVPEWFEHVSSEKEPQKPHTFPLTFGPHTLYPHKDVIDEHFIDEEYIFSPSATGVVPMSVQNKVLQDVKEWNEKWDTFNNRHAAWQKKDGFERASQWAYEYAISMNVARQEMFDKAEYKILQAGANSKFCIDVDGNTPLKEFIINSGFDLIDNGDSFLFLIKGVVHKILK